jgi:hypothetical protein
MPETPSNDISRPILTWESLDAYPHARGMKWYVVGGIFLFGFALYGIRDGSFSTVLVALLLGGMYVLLHKHRPRSLPAQVSGLGIQFGERFHSWNELRDFWIVIPESRAGRLAPELHLRFRKAARTEAIIFLTEVDPGDVRKALLEYLPERPDMQERFLDMLARILKL